MLATHFPKFADQALQLSGIQKIIDFDVPSHLICSKNITLRQLYWACPSSAAYIREWREISELVKEMLGKGDKDGIYSICHNDTPVIQEAFPMKMDFHMKSSLLPLDYIDPDKNIAELPYVAATPVSSLSVVHEVFKRGFELGTINPLVPKILQPNAMAYSNHGETLILQAGRYRSFHTHVPKVISEIKHTRPVAKVEDRDGDFKYPYLRLTARVTDANVSAGLIAEGIPSITAIGGFVHMLERATNQNIDFALGFRDVAIHYGKKRYIDQSGKNKAKLIKGTISNTRFVNEITGDFEITILFKCSNTRKLKAYLSNNDFRIAGGKIWDKSIGYKLNIKDNSIAWLYGSSKFSDKIDNYFYDNPKIIVHRKSDGEELEIEPDLLDCAIHLRSLREYDNTYSINSNGYIFLEEPKERTNVRTNGHKHVFSEPCFCLINLCTTFDESKLFWRRYSSDKMVYWN